MDFAEHVLVVVRGRAIRPQACFDPCTEELEVGRDAAGELEVRGGAGCDADAFGCQRGDVFVGGMDTVGGDAGHRKCADAFGVADGGAIAVDARFVDLTRGLGQMSDQWDAVCCAEFDGFGIDFVSAGIRCVWGDGGSDPWVSVPGVDEAGGALEADVERRRIGCGQAHNRLATDSAHAGLVGSPGDFFFVKVHIDEGRRAAPDHLGTRQERACADKFGRYKAPFDGEHVAEQPDIELQISHDAAQQTHRHMGMGVDEPGGDGAALTIDGLCGLVAGAEGSGAVDGDDGITVYSNGTIMENGAVLIHGDDRCVTEQQIDRVHVFFLYGVVDAEPGTRILQRVQ